METLDFIALILNVAAIYGYIIMFLVYRIMNLNKIVEILAKELETRRVKNKQHDKNNDIEHHQKTDEIKEYDIDNILDKINEKGLDSLSKEELEYLKNSKNNTN